MQERDETKFNGQVKLKQSIQNYEVPGFFDAYEDHVDQHAAANFGGWLLLICGAAIVMLSIWILIYGPSEIYYYRSKGMSFWQHMQMRPGLVALVGSALTAAGSRMRTEGSMSREAYLLSRYEIIDPEGKPVSTGLQACYVSENEFKIFISPAGAQHRGAA